MTDRPDPVLDRTECARMASLPDPLSDVFGAVRLRGSAFFMLDRSLPWAVGVPDGQALASILVPRPQQVISYHVITRGACWCGLLDAAPVRLETGDVVVFPRGDGYFMSLTPWTRVAPDFEETLAFLKEVTAGHLPFVAQGGGGGAERLSVICGFLGCDVRPFNPLLATLPRLFHIQRASRAQDDPVDRLVRLTELMPTESFDHAAGRDTLRSRLNELMFVEIIRRYMTDLPAQYPGWLAGLRDESVGRALRLLHEQAAHRWTMDELAGEVGLSRSALTDRFANIVGDPPVTYLTRWRMQKAARLLTDGSANLAAIALEVGYASAAAFSRAFKRITGVSPVAWRRQQPARPTRRLPD
jgi:AraC-like DNA-binding protein